MDIDVTSVSRRAERVWDAAAAVEVITNEQLRRSGATSLAEALRLAQGLAVARGRNATWAISARGFQITTANKLEVRIDGRSVYTPLFSGVFWDVQDTMLEDVERIEIIRGPGGSIWGANAVNGVINVVTRRARDAQGAAVEMISGNEERAAVGVRYGSTLGKRGHYRAYSKVFYRDGVELSTGRDAGDDVRHGQGGFRIDWDQSPGTGVTIQGDVYTGRIGVFDEEADTSVSGANVLGRWTRRFSPRSELQAQFYYDRTYREIPQEFVETRGTYDVDVQHQFRPNNRHALIYGAAYRLTRDTTEATPSLFWDPPERDSPLFSVFAQDEIALRPRLFLTVGSKFEDSDYTSGLEVQPTLRLRWNPQTRRQTLWGAISRAVRMPTRIDEDLRIITGSVVTLRGDRAFDSEKVVAYELGYRIKPATALSLELASFYNVYDDLRSQELPATGLPIVLGNTLEGRTAGVEVGLVAETSPFVRWQTSYSFVDTKINRQPGSRDISGGVSEANDARHRFKLLFFADVTANVHFDGMLRAVSALPNPRVPAYSELDLRLGWTPTPRLELSLIGRNLLHRRHPEFGAADPEREELERSVYGRAVWRF